MPEITLNGEPRQTAATTISELVRELGQPPEMLLIEHNGIALHRSEWPQTALSDRDRLEVLRVAAGG